MILIVLAKRSFALIMSRIACHNICHNNRNMIFFVTIADCCSSSIPHSATHHQSAICLATPLLSDCSPVTSCRFPHMPLWRDAWQLFKWNFSLKWKLIIERRDTHCCVYLLSCRASVTWYSAKVKVSPPVCLFMSHFVARLNSKADFVWQLKL